MIEKDRERERRETVADQREYAPPAGNFFLLARNLLFVLKDPFVLDQRFYDLFLLKTHFLKDPFVLDQRFHDLVTDFVIKIFT